MTIGIIGAMDEEVALLLKNMTDKKETTIANCLFVQGELFGKDVVLLKSGIGKVNASMATTIMHERFSPSDVINTGSARSEEHTSELQSRGHLVCRLLLEKKKKRNR